MNKQLLFLWFAVSVAPAQAVEPKYRVLEDRVVLEHVNTECPVIYDNDWWKDVPDAAYLWVKASLGQVNLRGNIVTRDMWNWDKGYQFKLDEGLKEAESLLDLARKSGVKNVPDPVRGANEILLKPKSGKIEDTKWTRTAGSELIVKEARRADPKKPLLVFVGGPCTTVANAYLSDPTIADRMIVFQVDGGAYNGKDTWSWEIVQQRCLFVNWAKGYFWGEWSRWNPKAFDKLPNNPLGETLKKYARSDLGKANQWGDGAWIFHLFEPRCLTKLEKQPGFGLTVPRDGTNISMMETEFFKTMTHPKAFASSKD